MIHTKDILKSLPLLAGVLGKKYGVEVRIGGSEAYTNGNCIQFAVQACYAVASALHSIQGMNVAVTTFSGKGGLHSTTVSPTLAHGKRLHANMQVYANGGTPLGEALWWVIQQMVSLREQRKIMLILTDGAPNDVPLASKALARAHDCGFEVYGIGCGTDSLQYLLPSSQ